ncbi:endolytic transglycosylase MltG [Thalassotalea sediminis]|uniref:endolytic transglycosylase MltG n=1 Tax=Thalassotalea sediminis TaxID=1759089 RepID=UPI002572E087|nr:endolytic transglycosylase MltG [Thalassotalea sediminis]
MQFIRFTALSTIKKLLIIGIISVLVVFFTLIRVTEYQVEQLNRLDKPLMIEIERGTSFNHFARQLEMLGIVKESFWLKVYVKFNPAFANIKAGNYQIEQDQRIKDILLMITQGLEHQYKITFIEGSTLKQWLMLLAQHPNITKTLNYQNKATLYQQVAKALSLENVHPEGLFFPETYAFTHKTRDIDILKRAYSQMQMYLDSAWQQRYGNLPYKDKYEALIMASIIEKESGQAAEHEIISSVFVNRLEKNMRLQTDPTIIYGLGERYKGDIKRKHMREKTAYNTYRINGLPPTPIAMPGKSALMAAMQPAQTDYFYFVSDGKGKHIFSRTLKEHNKAVVKYQLP